MVFIPLGIAIFGLYHLMWRSGKNIFLLTLWLAVAFLGLIASWLVLRWRLGIWTPTFHLPLGFWLATGGAVIVGIAAAIANRIEQKQRSTEQE